MPVERGFEVDKGFRYRRSSVSILIRALAMTKRGQVLSDHDLVEYSNAILGYLNSVDGSLEVLQSASRVLQGIDFDELSDAPFYKFVPEHVLKDHICRGSFQFGTCQYYREVENQNAKDHLEGYSTVAIDVGQQQVVASVLSGFNCAIFCGTAELGNRELLSRKFGGRIILVRSARSFALAVCERIRARRYYIGRVAYADAKLLRAKAQIQDLSAVNPDLSDELFDLFLKQSFFPSLFSKPTRFDEEREIRLVFEFDADVPTPFIRIDSQDLSGLIEIVQ